MAREERVRYVLAGAAGALLLGLALSPLRSVTAASNLAFPFLLLTVVVAETTGPMAVVATALASALSLDFFLTEPYGSFTISDPHDAVAFFGLVTCGLVVAVASGRRAARIAALDETAAELHLLREVVRLLGNTPPDEVALRQALVRITDTLPVTAAVLRDEAGRVLAASGEAAPAAPRRLLRPDTLQVEGLGPELEVVGAEIPLPSDGARVRLRYGDRGLGWLDVWGNGLPATPGMRRTLFDVARLVSATLAR